MFMSDIIFLESVAKSLADILDPGLGAYIVFNPRLPEMRFNFPAVVYFNDNYATCVCYSSGDVFYAEYADPAIYPDCLVQKIQQIKTKLIDSIRMKPSENFPPSSFSEELLDYITKNIE